MVLINASTAIYIEMLWRNDVLGLASYVANVRAVWGATLKICEAIY